MFHGVNKFSAGRVSQGIEGGDSHTNHIYLSTGPSCTTHSARSGIWGDLLMCVVHLLVSHAVRPRDTSLHLVHTGGKGGNWTLPSLVMLVCSRAGL